MIDVLVVDDSALVRARVTRWLESEPDLRVVARASDGEDALVAFRLSSPDAVVLDLEMPRGDGIWVLEQLRACAPRLPIVMFSSRTRVGSRETVRALLAGASDWIAKPVAPSEEAETRGQLVAKLRALTGRAHDPSDPSVRPLKVGGPPIQAVVVAASTGGPKALAEFLGALLPVPVPVCVVQHMPEAFVEVLADQLRTRLGAEIRLAEERERLVPGMVRIARAGHHLVAEATPLGPRLRLDDGPPRHSAKPAADLLFASAATALGRVVAVVLTGMGSDGRDGARAVVEAGGLVMAQDAVTSVVWGMPGAVVRAGLASTVGPPAELAAAAADAVETSAIVRQA
jgi:two-component system chemotaxis response regulator CheB